MDDQQTDAPEVSTAPPAQSAEPLPASGYRDDELVYVDTENRVVVGRVEWSNSGRPKSLQQPQRIREEAAEEPAKPGKPGRRPGRGDRKPRIRYYPWGTYRAMKRLYKLEGKIPEQRGNATLDEILPKALTEPFWD